ncbi:MAG TPA: hypothetical protein VEY67_13085 [Candidatus Dormibacteraeota bacterium]|nr:hypothetical protein [Candidatus Dormibacteraeota bacterium]
MQGRHPRPRIASPRPDRRPTGAITWIERDRALVARRGPAGDVDVAAIGRDVSDPESFFARVAHEIGDRDRVIVVGPGSLRTRLEREYVAIYQRPERLVDVEPTARLSEADLVERLRDLSS